MTSDGSGVARAAAVVLWLRALLRIPALVLGIASAIPHPEGFDHWLLRPELDALVAGLAPEWEPLGSIVLGLALLCYTAVTLIYVALGWLLWRGSRSAETPVKVLMTVNLLWFVLFILPLADEYPTAGGSLPLVGGLFDNPNEELWLWLLSLLSAVVLALTVLSARQRRARERGGDSPGGARGRRSAGPVPG